MLAAGVLIALAYIAPKGPHAHRSARTLVPGGAHLVDASRVNAKAIRMNLFDNLFGGRREDAEKRNRDGGALDRPVKSNKYFDSIQNISAPELVQNFARTAPPEVQQAIKATVMGLFGSMPPGQFESSITTTSQNLVSLMYSMQMTGYMFRNAAYRMSLKQSLEKAGRMLPGERLPDASKGQSGPQVPKVSGKIEVDLGLGQKVEVDAAAYVADLHKEVAQLKSALARVEVQDGGSKEGTEGNLLAFMQSLPREQLQGLSASVSPEVLECMQMLIEAVLARDAGVLGAGTIVESSGPKMRELLVWQLVTGYQLRELEQRDELDRLLKK